MSFPTPDMPLTHILIVRDVGVACRWYTDVLGAELHREYGGDSAVLSFLTPPMDRGGETCCFFRDPDGHLFEVSEYRG